VERRSEVIEEEEKSSVGNDEFVFLEYAVQSRYDD
jgi:hypothetical protein